MSGQRLLIVRAGGRPLGLPMDDVLEVSEPGAVQSVPAQHPALRGVIEARGRLVSLFHLGALLAGGVPEGPVGDTIVIAEVGGQPVALEVDEVDAAPVDERLAALDHPGLAAWASGAVRRGTSWIPVLNLGLLAERWGRTEEGSA